MPLEAKDLQPIAYHGGYPAVVNGFIIGEDGIVEGSQGHKIKKHLTIEWRGKSWAVTDSLGVLDKVELTFVYSPLPSSRTEEHLQRTRFETLDEACDAINRYREAAILEFREWLNQHPEGAEQIKVRSARLQKQD